MAPNSQFLITNFLKLFHGGYLNRHDISIVFILNRYKKTREFKAVIL